MSSLSYQAVFTVAPRGANPPPGDKIILPPSALEQLLSAAAAASSASSASSAIASQQASYDDPWGMGRRTTRRPDEEPRLPQPLMFRLTNTATRRSVYAGIREFSAEEGQVVLSEYLREALHMDGDGGGSDENSKAAPKLLVQTRALRKGTFVRLRPLLEEDERRQAKAVVDWRPLLERQLRESFTTLTKAAVFSVRGVQPGEVFRFRVEAFDRKTVTGAGGSAETATGAGGSTEDEDDEDEATAREMSMAAAAAEDGICVVDTDLEVDLEAPSRSSSQHESHDQKTTVAEAAAASAGDAAPAAPTARPLDIFRAATDQVVGPGDYVDYTLASWDRSRPLAISLIDEGPVDSKDGGDEPGLAVDLLVSPLSPRQRVRPRESEHIWAHFGAADSASEKTVTIAPTAVDVEEAEAILVAVHGWPGGRGAHRFSLRARTVLEEEAETSEKGGDPGAHPGEERCPNCRQWVPQQSLVLHESFCRRNNVACPHCRQVFPQRSAAWAEHWHCNRCGDDDGAHGNTAASKAKHDAIFHAEHACPAETGKTVVFPSLPALAQHRTGACPAKLILCRFCHLEVAQEGDGGIAGSADTAETALTGLTAHERADGARTTECYLCDAIVRLRDMRTHLQHHDLDRRQRAQLQAPPLCRNALCGRTLFGVGPRGAVASSSDSSSSTGSLGLCSSCFAPLYASTHDPDGKALRRRVERRYLIQLLSGCGKPWCANPWCKTGRQHQQLPPLAGGVAALLPLVRPLLEEAMASNGQDKATHFCVGEDSQRRRAIADMVAAQGRYALPWCVAACEAVGAEAKARAETLDVGSVYAWLDHWAPPVEVV